MKFGRNLLTNDLENQQAESILVAILVSIYLTKAILEHGREFNERNPYMKFRKNWMTNEPWHEISNNVVCATSKASDQPAQMRSLIRAFACRLNIL